MEFHLPQDGPRGISDITRLQELGVELLNALGAAREELARTQEQLQAALDEINRLKGEKGRPRFKKSRSKTKIKSLPKVKSAKSEASSPSEPATDIPVDREQILDTAPADLPADAEFKGYRSVIQRNIRIVRDNVRYLIGRWYSPSLGKTYEAELPKSYRGQIGSDLQSLVQMFHHCCDMTQGKIRELLTHLDTPLSSGSISNLVTHSDWAEAERSDLHQSALAIAPYINMDNTQSKQAGQRKHTQVIGSTYFSLYYTQTGRSRLDVYAALQGQSRQEVGLLFNEQASKHMMRAKVSEKHQKFFEALFCDGQVRRLAALEMLFDSEAIFAKTNKKRRTSIASALAAGYYYQQNKIPVVTHLITDDASEYRWVATQSHMLCWVHEIRLYRTLVARVDYHHILLTQFIDQLWKFYDRIKAYQTLPEQQRAAQKQLIIVEFDQLFRQQTDYDTLNKQIRATKAKADQLLAFLEHAPFPLHNNLAERSIRRVVRKRDISLHTWSQQGTKMRDVFMSLYQTANQLGISFMDYLLDRNAKTYQMQSLASRVVNAYLA